MNLLQVFSSNLYRYRKQRGFTQAQLADSAGLHRTYISAVERGKRNISIDNIEKIALTLKVDAYLLFVDTENQQIPIVGNERKDHISSKGGIANGPGSDRAKNSGRYNKL